LGPLSRKIGTVSHVILWHARHRVSAATCYWVVMTLNRREARLVLRPDMPFNGIKVFSATLFNDRQQLGDKVTAWIADNPRNELTEIVVTQSSDAAFHCIALTLFYRSRDN
jgi:hypothetical protein